MKQYLLSIKSGCGANMNIIAQTDSTKPIYIYYCGHDTGKRYISVGAAARYLEKIADQWGNQTIKEYGTTEKIPVFGYSEWNKQLFKYQYCGGSFPRLGLL